MPRKKKGIVYFDGQEMSDTAVCYVPPWKPRNKSDKFILPPNRKIVHDFRIAGGSLQVLAETVLGEKNHPLMRLLIDQIYEQLEEDPDNAELFGKIQERNERINLSLSKDRAVQLSETAKSEQAQLAAIKAVQQFGRDLPQREVTDPLDAHIEALERNDSDK